MFTIVQLIRKSFIGERTAKQSKKKNAQNFVKRENYEIFISHLSKRNVVNHEVLVGCFSQI